MFVYIKQVQLGKFKDATYVIGYVNYSYDNTAFIAICSCLATILIVAIPVTMYVNRRLRNEEKKAKSRNERVKDLAKYFENGAFDDKTAKPEEETNTFPELIQ